MEDLYIDGTPLRMREVTESGCAAVFKLTQKVPERGKEGRQGWITNFSHL